MGPANTSDTIVQYVTMLLWQPNSIFLWRQVVNYFYVFNLKGSLNFIINFLLTAALTQLS